jgi:filamentous hemagglutinin family protein
MRRRIAELWVALAAQLIVAAGVGAQPVATVVVADDTFGTIVEQSGTTIVVTGGTAVGPNLFHSLAAFDVARGDRVEFRAEAPITTVVVRVIGSPARIAGDISRGADVYLLDPSGVELHLSVVAPDPTLVAASAQAIILADGATFSAETTPADVSAAAPAAFAFRGGSLAEIVDGSLVFEGGDLLLVHEQVFTNRNIEVRGRSLRLDGSFLGVARSRAPDAFRIDVERSLELVNDSLIESRSHSSPHPIEIRAREVSITSSAIRGFSDFCSPERGGDVLTLETRSVRLSEASSVIWNCGTGSREHSLRFVASDSVVLEGGSIVRVHSTDVRPAPIVIEDPRGRQGTLQVELSGQSAIESSFRNAIGGSGGPGIRVLAQSLLLDGSRFITGHDVGSAALNIDFDLVHLSLRNGSSLSARGGFEGDGAEVHLVVRSSIDVIDSGIDASGGTGRGRRHGGEIEISGSPAVRLDRARIEVPGLDSGGTILLGTTENPLRAALLRHSALDATSAEGDGGAIAIHARSLVVSRDTTIDVTGATSDGTIEIDSHAHRR